ncbi:MAG: phosphoribosylformylglycinamidine cyclo-ligase [Pseudomonadota bacterium]
MSETTPPPLTYKDAGVDIDAGNALVERIGDRVKRTHRPGVLTGLGGFGGLFALDLKRFNDPVLVSGTDGVGTKLLLARQLDQHSSIGIDLVAMCVNDIVVCGAEPLFFLDYFATGALDVGAAETVINGIARGCEIAGCALIGGETAEMPGMYGPGEYDLAGFCVGAVNRPNLIDGSTIVAGDVVIGLASSGAHSNGYSLIRKIAERCGEPMTTPIGETTLGEALLAPTRIYVKSLLALCEQVQVRGIAHITGGGLLENIPRVLPGGLDVALDRSAWQPAPVFAWLQQRGSISDTDMQRTFNCGLGAVVIVRPDDAAKALDNLSASGEQASIVGQVHAGDGNVVIR